MQRLNKKSWYAIMGVLAVVLGVSWFAGRLREPAPKPLPSPGQTVPQPIPEVPAPPPLKFDVSKYTSEPTISLYVAETGQKLNLPLEQYIMGVIAKEMEPDWPIEALAAQAVAARTLTLSAKEAGTIRKIRGTDASTLKEELQAYAPNKINDNVREAVRRSRGQVLLYNQDFVNAIYHACCGQITATREEAFPKQIPEETPYFSPVQCPCYEYAPEKYKDWTVKFNKEAVRSAVGYGGSAEDVSILSKGASGRVLTIGAGDKQIYGAEFRQRIGFDVLKSTLITEMHYEGGQVVISGKGWGNGVGMCQWGAYTLAQQGKIHEDIMRFYYKDTEIRKLY